ncbi:transcriptional regulator [Mesorhizobium sp. YR577]|nr:transcriptional regulator [Mesorhizobium sp. YR577]
MLQENSCYRRLMPSPFRPPIGLTLHRISRQASRAFDEALGEVGGSLPVWLTLLTMKTHKSANQRELAAAIGIQGATLTHHLNGMETDGLLTRRRDPANRRVHLVELTAAGEATFLRLRDAAVAFDKKLRAGFSDDEIAALEQALAKLGANVGERV